MKTLSIADELGGGEVVIILLMLSVVVLPLAALINALQSDFKNKVDKISWVIVIIFLPFIGPILYFTVGRKSIILLPEEKNT